MLKHKTPFATSKQIDEHFNVHFDTLHTSAVVAEFVEFIKTESNTAYEVTETLEGTIETLLITQRENSPESILHLIKLLKLTHGICVEQNLLTDVKDTFLQKL